MPSGSDRRGPEKKSGAKSAKAIRSAHQKSGGTRAGTGAGSAGKRAPRNIPWMTIGAAAAVLALVAVITVNLVPKYRADEDVAQYVPTAENPDPSSNIDGVVRIDYPAGVHVQSTQRVAYDQSPPFGGPHDAVWATCTGTVYPSAIRTENAVHSLEHGAVWITYNPDTLAPEQVDTLKTKVDGKTYTLLSPYPGLDSPISLQSWGHQLELDSADDERIDHFITALRLNKNTYPEVGASCSNIPGSGFDPENPPAFDPNAPGPDAVPMSGDGISPDASESSQLPGNTQLPSDLRQAPTTGRDG